MAYVTGAGAGDTACFLCLAAEAEAGDGRDEGLIVERTDETLSLMNLFPYTSGHVLVAPRRHVADLRDLTPEEGMALLAATQRMLGAIGRALQPAGFNVGLNLGRAAGASIDHLHLHVVPRWGGDTNFMPVLADVKVLPEHVEVTAEKLREALARDPEATGGPVEKR
jgi:ATP adenylyltransferase